MTAIITQYLQILITQFQFDVMVFSTKLWIYYWLCIPALFYLWFFAIKWAVLTLPVWIAPTIVAKAVAKIFRK